jgi:hypothetical protein
MRTNIMTQNKPIRYVKKTFKSIIDTSLEKYDNIYYQNKYSIFYKGHLDIISVIKDKVSLATAWFNDKYSNIDWTRAEVGSTDVFINNTQVQHELRRKELNSNK